ncbi:MAG: hypothetical protein K2X31_11525 [Sphingopyxis sp.]|nr:hypothetical protein [Sphingopyxis sp.]
MASVFPGARVNPRYTTPVSAPSLARAMSWHASGALMLFALMQIAGLLLVDNAARGPAPFIALALVVLGAVPFARRLERRWARLAETALPSDGLINRFRQDRARLWRLALIVPPIWLGVAVLMTDTATAATAAF